MKKLSRAEMKHVMGGDEELEDIVICGGTGNYIEKCTCSPNVSIFYCCHVGLSTCVGEKCGNGSYACSKYTQ